MPEHESQQFGCFLSGLVVGVFLTLIVAVWPKFWPLRDFRADAMAAPEAGPAKAVDVVADLPEPRPAQLPAFDLPGDEFDGGDVPDAVIVEGFAGAKFVKLRPERNDLTWTHLGPAILWVAYTAEGHRFLKDHATASGETVEERRMEGGWQAYFDPSRKSLMLISATEMRGLTVAELDSQ